MHYTDAQTMIKIDALFDETSRVSSFIPVEKIEVSR
jgi:hypothetical protein